MTPLFRSQSPIRSAVVALAIALSLGALGFALVTTQKLRSSLLVVRKSNEARLALEQFLSTLKDAETSQRGYLITGDESYLEPFDSAIQTLPGIVEKLYMSSSGTEGERKEISALQVLSDQRIAALHEAITIRRQQGPDAAKEVIDLGKSRKMMDNLRNHLGRLISRHDEIVRSNRATMLNDLASGEIAALGAAVVALLCGFLALFLFRQAIRNAQSAERMAKEKLAAEAADREKSAFLATMSHEIRTPMNAILGFGEILRGELVDPRLRGFADSIFDSGQSLLRLINDVLDLSKIEAGKLDLWLAPVDLRDTATFLHHLFAAQAKQRGLNWEINVADDLPSSVLLDEMRVRQVLLNLVGNAFKFTPRGRITLSISGRTRADTSRSHVDLLFEVRDTGAGIPADELEKVFEPFVQAGKSGGSDSRGTGLGLAIVGRLVTSMGGRTSVESEPGVGSVFRVELPDVDISARIAVDARAGTAAAVDFDQLTPARILVVDDVETNRAFLREIFARTHHTVSEAVDGREAVSRVVRERPDIVLMDVRMPELNGPEALRQVRCIPGFELLPVIAVTASSLGPDEKEFRRDFSGYLRKPFSRVELFTELSAFLKKREPTEPVATAETAPQPLPVAAAARLRQIMLDDFPRVRDGLAVNDVRGFAEGMASLATEHDAPALLRLASELRSAAENFSVSRMEAVLKKFPPLVASLAPTA